MHEALTHPLFKEVEKCNCRDCLEEKGYHFDIVTDDRQRIPVWDAKKLELQLGILP